MVVELNEGLELHLALHEAGFVARDRRWGKSHMAGKRVGGVRVVALDEVHQFEVETIEHCTLVPKIGTQCSKIARTERPIPLVYQLNNTEEFL